MEKIQRKRIWLGKALGVLLLALAIGLMAAPGAKAANIDLLTAGPLFYAVLGLGTDLTLTASHVESVFPGFANVGALLPGNIVFTSGTLEGTVFVQNASQYSNIANIVPGGGVVVNAAKLTQANTDALARSIFYNQAATVSGLTAVGNATGTLDHNTTGFVDGALNFVTLSGNVLLTGTNTFTINAPLGTAVVFNLGDGDTFTMTGTSKILVSGGIRAEDVLFNLRDPDSDYAALTGGEIDGILLAPFAKVDFTGLVFGEVIGHDIAMHSTSTVNNPAPVPPSAILLGSGLLGLGLFGSRRKWFRRI